MRQRKHPFHLDSGGGRPDRPEQSHVPPMLHCLRGITGGQGVFSFVRGQCGDVLHSDEVPQSVRDVNQEIKREL